MNKILKDFARKWLKEHVALCTAEQQHIFKKMYSPEALDAPASDVADDIVDKLRDDQISWAMEQIENTLAANKDKERTTNA